MAAGFIDAQIVESPITVAKLSGAATIAITNTSATALLSVTSFNQGRSVAIIARET